jgi:hypothetical protein
MRKEYLLTFRYPVHESHQGPESLKGHSIKTGFTSHYVLVHKHGSALTEPKESMFLYQYTFSISYWTHNLADFYDEIVVHEESQIVPAFILKLEIDSCKDMVWIIIILLINDCLVFYFIIINTFRPVTLTKWINVRERNVSQNIP